MDESIKVLPLIPLRGITIFPYMVLHFDVGREKSIMALESAMLNGQEIFLIAQKDAKTEEPKENDIFTIGTVCCIKQILKLPGETVRILVEGENRAKIIEHISSEDFFQAKVKILEDEECSDEKQCEALSRSVKSSFNEYMKLSGNIPAETLVSLDEMEESGRLADVVSSYLNLKQEKKQELLEAIDVFDRLENVLVMLKNEIEILNLEREIGTKVEGERKNFSARTNTFHIHL